MDNLAPIALFVYDRPSHTKKTLEAISANMLADKTSLYVFIDGPKYNADPTTIERVKETKEIVKSNKWCKDLNIIERDSNLGLANSIISGVTELVNKFGNIIVLEDDLVTTKYFLTYMNLALKMYETEDRVACISGYNYPIEGFLPDTFFLKGADCWGWATWKRAWDNFEKDGTILAKQIQVRKIKREFDFDNSFPYFQMLQDQIAGKNNSWAIRWYASSFLKGQLCLYPRKSFIKNIGLDGSGTHSGTGLDFMNNKSFSENYNLVLNKTNIQEDKFTKALIIKYFRKNFKKDKFKFLKKIKQIIFKALNQFNF
jgi:hypothetical protein